jgi:hypothetical protein
MHVATELWRGCDWFLAHGADDVMHIDYLDAVLHAAAENPHANLIFSPWQWLGHPERGVKHFPPFNPETCHAEHQLPAWCAVRRDLLDAAEPWDKDLIAADWDWFVRHRHLIRAHQLDRPYIDLRVREGARPTLSATVHWPTLHRHLCEISGNPTPEWARC